MKFIPKFNVVLSFFLGAGVSALICIYTFAVGQLGHDATTMLSVSVDNYEMAVRQSSKEDVVLILNSRISCALNSLELVKNSDWPMSGIDENYNALIEKAYQLTKVPCDQPFKLNQL